MALAFQILSIVSLALGVAFLITAIILFFALDVVALIGEVSGKTAERQVQAIREQSKKTANRRRDDSKSSFERSSNQVARQLYDGNALRDKSGALTGRMKDNNDIVEATMPLAAAAWSESKTDSLEDGEATTVLLNNIDDEATTILSDMEATTVLSDNGGETEPLQPKGPAVQMLDGVSEVHSREIIDI